MTCDEEIANRPSRLDVRAASRAAGVVLIAIFGAAGVNVFFDLNSRIAAGISLLLVAVSYAVAKKFVASGRTSMAIGRVTHGRLRTGLSHDEEKTKRWRVSISDLLLTTGGIALSLSLLRYASGGLELLAGFLIFGGSIGALAERICSTSRYALARGFITGSAITGAMIGAMFGILPLFDVILEWLFG